MGLCETVATLAAGAKRDLAPTTARDKLLIAILRLMPLYRDMGELPAWEAAFRQALDEHDDESKIGTAILEIFELGTFNMYGAFDVAATQREYDALAQLLTNSGVSVPPDTDLTDW